MCYPTAYTHGTDIHKHFSSRILGFPRLASACIIPRCHQTSGNCDMNIYTCHACYCDTKATVSNHLTLLICIKHLSKAMLFHRPTALAKMFDTYMNTRGFNERFGFGFELLLLTKMHRLRTVTSSARVSNYCWHMRTQHRNISRF